MAVTTALKIGTQVIKHAPKLQKLTKLTKLQKVIKNVKSTKNVIQSKLNTKQNLARIGENINDARKNFGALNKIRKLNKAVSANTGVLRNTPWAKTQHWNKTFHSYMGGQGPKEMIRNLGKAKGWGKTGPALRFLGPALEIKELYDRTGQMLQKDYKKPIEDGPSNSLRNSISNLVTDVKNIRNRNKFRRTDLHGAADVKTTKWFTGQKWNPFDDEEVLIPNMAKRHNTRAEELRKLDTKYGNPKDKKK